MSSPPIKKIILYANRNTGMLVLSYLIACKYSVSIIHDGDADMERLCTLYSVPIVTLDTMGDYDLFICCHGRKILDEKYLITGKTINMHPCLFKYKGHNPIKRYIQNQDTLGSIESQYMVKEVDGGDVIHAEYFETPVIHTYAEFYNIALPYYYWCIHKTLEIIFQR